MASQAQTTTTNANETHAITTNASETRAMTTISSQVHTMTVNASEAHALTEYAGETSRASVVHCCRRRTYYEYNRSTKTFSYVTSLKRHEKMPHAQTDGYQNCKSKWPCPLCPKALSSRINLKVHMRQHTGERPFSCSLCTVKYTSLNALRKHMVVRHHVPKGPDASVSPGCPVCVRCYSGGPQTHSNEYRCIVCPFNLI